MQQQTKCLVCNTDIQASERLCSRCRQRPNDYGTFQAQKLRTEADEYLKRYYGVELEIESYGKKCRGWNNYDLHWQHITGILNGHTRFLYPKPEGTITNGVELVSAPMTSSARRQVVNWHEVLKTLRTISYASFPSGNCGLHIHVDRYRLPSFKKLTACMSRMPDFAALFSRRTPTKLHQWASIPTKPMDTIKSKSFAINGSHSATIEFRLFRGTLRWKTFIACLQFVGAFVDFATIQPESALCRNRETTKFTLDFIQFIKWRGYTHLYTYIKRNRRLRALCVSLQQSSTGKTSRPSKQSRSA